MGYLVFFLVLIGSTIAFGNTAYGLWMPQDPQELLEQSEMVFVGTVQSVNVLEFERSNTYEVEEDGKVRTIVENYTQTLDEYTVSIEEFLKNPLESSTITLLEATVAGVPGRGVSIGGFDTGDRVLFYVPKIDGTNQYSPESFKIPEHCDASSVLEKPRIIGVNDFTTRQNGIQLHDNFIANHPIEFVFNKDMRTLDGNDFEVSVGISKVTENQRQIIFEKTIQAESAPCEWIATVAWDVTLDEGKYRMDMHETGDLRVNTSSMSIHVVADTIKYLPEHIDPDPLLDLWNKHSEIIDGTIISKTTYPGTGKGPTEFHVKVNKFFKPLSKTTESITLFASYADSDIPSVLNKGDRALIYIEPKNQISRYSVKVDKSTYCEPRDYIQIAPVLPNDPNQLVRGPPTLPFDWKDQCVADDFTRDPNFWQYREYRPPMQQWKVHNIPMEQQRCSGEGEDFVSMQKIGNSNYKYCVNPESVPKLVERGWIKMSDTEKNHVILEQQTQSIVIIPKGAVIEGNENLIPKEITVVLGKNNTITWINQDDTAHGISSDDASWGSRGIIHPGDSFSVTFNSTGIYDYHGQPHPWETGTVIVLEE